MKAALFDLDGTLIDTEGQYTIIWGRIARKYRPDIPGLEHLIKGTTLPQILSRYFPPETHDAVTKEINEGEANLDFRFYPGALEFVQELRSKGVKCAIVTSSSPEKMNSLRKKIPQFDSLFDRVFSAEMFTASKPAPDCYIMAAREMDTPKSECVVFEDAYTGLQAGMASGIFTIGMATEHSREELQGKCDLILDSMQGLSLESLQELHNHWLRQESIHL